MTKFHTAIIYAAIITCAFVMQPGQADKLRELGLTSEGKPPAVSQDTLPTLLHLPGAEGLAIVPRPELHVSKAASVEEQAAALMAALLAGPTPEEQQQGLRSPFPVGSRYLGLEINALHVGGVKMELPAAYLKDRVRLRAEMELLEQSVAKTLQHLPLAGSYFLARPAGSAEEFRPLDHFAPPPEPPAPVAEADLGGLVSEALASAPALSNYVPSPGSGRPAGTLSGKAVYLNPGHGWVWRPSYKTFGVQRGFVQNNIEDFSNVDWIQSYLFTYCYNAGADVFSVRELDPNTNMVIVDNDDGNDGQKGYFESGTGWSTSSLKGFANGNIPYTSGQDPFSFGTTRLLTCVTGAPTASATWIPEMPKAGWYNVYVSHAAFTNRSPEAHYRVHHAGGTTDYFLDQRQRRFTWIFIGRYYFEAGINPDTAKVVLFNNSTSTSHYVSADAVRFGGGTGLIYRSLDGTGSVSNKPRYDEDARYHVQFSGASTSIYDASSRAETDNQADEADGWYARPAFGRWLKQQAETYGAPAQDSVFVSSHTNAGGGTGLGTFVYTGQENTWHDRFRNFVHAEVLNDLSVGYSATFKNHGTGIKYGTYSENNPSNVSNLMPIFLGEWLFHDSASDMALYHDPKFRMMMARAVYQGIVKFWAAEKGAPAILLPEPPRHLRIEQLSPTSARLSWLAPETDAQNIRGHAATGYKIYRGTHGRGFPAGISTGSADTQYTVSDLVPGQTTYFYISATNAGGESLPTETLAVKTSADAGAPKLLIVSGFDKLDIATRVQSSWSGDMLYRQIIPLMNSHDFIVEHARALDAWDYPLAFDSCEHEAVGTAAIGLGNYSAVIWIAGLQAEVSTTDPTNDVSISPAQQAALSAYLQGGGKLFLSGACVAWDLDRAGITSWVDTTLKANYVSDNANSFVAHGSEHSIFDGLYNIAFDDGSGSTYRVHWPDVIAPAADSGAVVAMQYPAASGGPPDAGAVAGAERSPANVSTTYLLDGFEALGGWRDPNYSSQTNAHADSTFTIATTPVRSGSGSGNLYYVWGTGNYIREYNTALPQFPSNAIFSLWVHGDNSGHQLRVCVRDSDADLFVSNWMTINFSGWAQWTWDIANGPTNVWVQSSNGTVDGPALRLDSIHVQKVSAVESGNLYFDDAEYTLLGPPPVGDAAAIQYDGNYKLVYMAYPFETIRQEAMRNDVMARVLEFFGLIPGTQSTGWMLK